MQLKYTETEGVAPAFFKRWLSWGKKERPAAAVPFASNKLSQARFFVAHSQRNHIMASNFS